MKKNDTISLKNIKIDLGNIIFYLRTYGVYIIYQQVAISLGMVVIPRTYEKLNCKGETYRFSSLRDPSVQTDRHTSC